jgi:hypothetical protein
MQLDTHVCTSAGAMNGEYTNVIGSEAPDGEGAAERRNTLVETLEHTIDCECILLLAGSFALYISNPRCEVFLVDGLISALAIFHLIAQKLLLISKPLRDLLAAEGQLTCAVLEIKNGKRMLRGYFTSDGKSSATRSGNGSSCFVTIYYGEQQLSIEGR